MLKQTSFYFIATFILIFFKTYTRLILSEIAYYFNWLFLASADVFNSLAINDFYRKLILIILIPFLLALIPAGIYRLVKGTFLPYFNELVWILWLILVICITMVK